MSERLINSIENGMEELLSLNFLLAEKVYVSRVSKDLKSHRARLSCDAMRNDDYFGCLFHKHISRYLNEIENNKTVMI